MSKEKQIEEIAEAICGLKTSEGCFCDGGYCNHNCLAHEKAEHLYNAGYRRQSEGRWEKIAFGNLVTTVRCGNCGEREDLAFYEKPYCPNCGAKMKGESNEQGKID